MRRSATNSTKRYRRILLLVLVVAAVLHYRSVEHRKMVKRAAAELAVDGARLRSIIETNRITRSRDLEIAFEQIRQESRLSIVWIHVRDVNSVQGAQIHVVQIQGAAAVVETFPIHSVDPVSGSPWKNVADREPRVRIIEIAARLDRMPTGLRRAPRHPTNFLSPKLANRAGEMQSTGMAVNSIL